MPPRALLPPSPAMVRKEEEKRRGRVDLSIQPGLEGWLRSSGAMASVEALVCRYRGKEYVSYLGEAGTLEASHMAATAPLFWLEKKAVGTVLRDYNTHLSSIHDDSSSDDPELVGEWCRWTWMRRE